MAGRWRRLARRKGRKMAGRLGNGGGWGDGDVGCYIDGEWEAEEGGKLDRWSGGLGKGKGCEVRG